MLKLVLLKTVFGLGDIGDVVSVRPGYARNYLVPRGFAVIASTFALARLSLQHEQVRLERESTEKQYLDSYTKLEQICGKVCIYVTSGMDGKFFGSVSVHDFIAAVEKLGVPLDRRQVYFPGKKIKSVGDYEALVRVGKERSLSIPFSVLSVNSLEESVDL